MTAKCLWPDDEDGLCTTWVVSPTDDPRVLRVWRYDGRRLSTSDLTFNSSVEALKEARRQGKQVRFGKGDLE